MGTSLTGFTPLVYVNSYTRPVTSAPCQQCRMYTPWCPASSCKPCSTRCLSVSGTTTCCLKSLSFGSCTVRYSIPFRTSSRFHCLINLRTSLDFVLRLPIVGFLPVVKCRIKSLITGSAFWSVPICAFECPPDVTVSSCTELSDPRDLCLFNLPLSFGQVMAVLVFGAHPSARGHYCGHSIC